MPGRMPQTRTPPPRPESPAGFNRQSSSTSLASTIACAPRHGVVVTAEVFRTDRLQLRAAILPIRDKPLLNTEAAMKRLLFATLAVLSCSVASSADAANLTPQAIRKSLASAGYGAELLRTDTEGHALIRTGTEMRTAMHLDGCTKAGCANAHIRAYLNNEHKLQTGDMNRINAAIRWIKVYLDEDGDVAIEMDVDLPKNASTEIPATALKRFEAALTQMVTKHAAAAGSPLRRARPTSQGQDI